MSINMAVVLRAVCGALTVLVCGWGYWLAGAMAVKNHPQAASHAKTIRTIKRRLIIKGLIGGLILFSAEIANSWLGIHAKDIASISPLGRQIVLATFTLFLISFLIMLTAIWDVVDRNNAADHEMYEQFHARLQKRRTDPAIGQPLESDQ